MVSYLVLFYQGCTLVITVQMPCSSLRSGDLMTGLVLGVFGPKLLATGLCDSGSLF